MGGWIDVFILGFLHGYKDRYWINGKIMKRMDTVLINGFSERCWMNGQLDKTIIIYSARWIVGHTSKDLGVLVGTWEKAFRSSIL